MGRDADAPGRVQAVSSPVLLVLVAVVVLASGWPAAAEAPAGPSPALSVSYTLYGSATAGWGDSPSSMSTPGPTLTAYINQTVVLSLYSADGAAHDWFLDLNGNLVIDPGEPSSGVFNDTVTISFVPYVLGTMMYRCAIHPSSMYGTFQVEVGDRTPPTVAVVSSLEVPVGQPIPVRANVSDSSGIQEAILYYTVGLGSPQWTVMNGTGSGVYSAFLPPQANPTYVRFYIQAIDGAGNTGRTPANGTYTITVGPPNLVPSPLAGVGPTFLALLIGVVALGSLCVVVSARYFGRRPPGKRPGNP